MNRPLDLQKKELRKILKEKRNALDPDTCRSSDTAIFKAITSWDVYQKPASHFIVLDAFSIAYGRGKKRVFLLI